MYRKLLHMQAPKILRGSDRASSKSFSPICFSYKHYNISQGMVTVEIRRGTKLEISHENNSTPLRV